MQETSWGEWITGGYTTQTEEMLVAVDAKQQEVIDQGLQVGKFLGTLLLDTAVVLPKIQVGLLTGDLEMVQTALHGSETHRKIFEMVAEVLTQTSEDLTRVRPKGLSLHRVVCAVPQGC